MPTLDDSTLQAVNNGNFKVIGEMGALNALSSQQTQNGSRDGHLARVQVIAEASLGQIVNRMNSLDPLEASAASRVHRTPSGDAGIDAATVVSLAQQLMKGAQTTPPVTAAPSA